MGDIDVSAVTDMGELFERSKRTDFSGIESWDASQVIDVSSMFFRAEFFNTDISKWNVSNVKNMSRMFSWATSFNQPLESWDISKVENMDSMFYGAESFSHMLDSWNLSVEKLKKYFEKHDDF
ncbi:BspA family leucine-rich repeat surface protein [Helicobacter bilis]|uniref:BspA family leucine-rich repeat surface protein n=1 Tax=Helicobacter bilis TaxID=37372 RepID=UPI0025581970|nr:BspA family leucine-rich repeat surface protein [Helicobacter bilis]